MDKPRHFEIRERCAFFRPEGESSLKEAVQLVSMAIRFCGDQKIQRLLVNVTALSGLQIPEVLDRYALAEQFASVAAPGMKLVLVAKAEMIDARKFGVTVARNRGLMANVFSGEGDALAWLMAENCHEL
jgi:hypothetical protein